MNRFVLPCLLAASLSAADTPMWTDDPGRNRYSTATNVPEQLNDQTLRWQVRTGGKYNFGIPALVRDGQVVLGSTGQAAKDFGRVGGSGSLLSYDLNTGALRWATPLASQGYGLCSSPLEDDGRIYVQGGMLWCFDADGMADGNDGPFTDELRLLSSRDSKELGLQDADRIWYYDYRKALDMGKDAHHGHAGTPLIVGDQIWVPTSFSHDERGMNIHIKTQSYGKKENGEKRQWNDPDPAEVSWKPNLLVFDKHTGELLAQDTVRMPEVYHGCWSSLSAITVAGRQLVLWGDGYGVLHAFDVPESKPGAVQTLERVWHYDGNPQEHRYDEDGNKRWFPYVPWQKGDNYSPEKPWGPNEADSPNYIIAAAVAWEGKVYLVTGRDYNYDFKAGGPRAGAGALHCIDPSGSGDISQSGRVWMRTDLGRCSSVGAIDPEGRLFISDNRGFIYCYDARTGEKRWEHQLEERSHNFYCAPLVADGKIYVGTSDKMLYVMRAGDQAEVLSSIKLDSTLVAPTAIDGYLVVPTYKSLYMFAK